MSKEKHIDLFRNNLGLKIENDLNNNEQISYSLRPQRIQVSENEQIKHFFKSLIFNKYILYKCAICDAIFFDAKDLKQHFQHSQQLELQQLKIENPNKSLALNRRILYKHLRQKYTAAFNNKNFKWLDVDQDVGLVKIHMFVDLLNSFSFKKVNHNLLLTSGFKFILKIMFICLFFFRKIFSLKI